MLVNRVFCLLIDADEAESCQLLTETSKADVNELQEQVRTLADRNAVLEQEVERLECLLDQYEQVSGRLLTKQSEVINLYKEIVDNGNLLGGLLSISEKNEIKLELEKAKKIFNLNFRKGKQVVDILECLEPMLFTNILSSLRESCPTIINVLEQIALSSNAHRNVKKTENMKMKHPFISCPL